MQIDLVIMAENEANVKDTTKKFLKNGNNIELTINDKTKYMVVF